MDSTNVALLAEGVDRNTNEELLDPAVALSPSSRRAWIEIPVIVDPLAPWLVALLAEGVDRNVFPNLAVV